MRSCFDAQAIVSSSFFFLLLVLLLLLPLPSANVKPSIEFKNIASRAGQSGVATSERSSKSSPTDTRAQLAAGQHMHDYEAWEKNACLEYHDPLEAGTV